MHPTASPPALALISQGAARNWHAVLTAPRHEKRVEEHLGVREIENFLPVCQVNRQWKDGSKGIVRLPLFPRYIFVHMGPGERIPVLSIPGVVTVLGSGTNLFAVPDSYIHFLREGLREGKIEPHPYLNSGDRVRIHSGVMAGMEGILVRKKNDFRVVLTLELIMKSVKVEVPACDIEPVGRVTSVPWSDVVEIA